MLQPLATLIFIAAALAALTLMGALIAGEWQAVLRSLGLTRMVDEAPLPPRVRVLAAGPVPILRVTPGALRRAA